jgi:hypothetical protein
MSFRLSFHRALLDRTGAHWLGDSPDLSCRHDTRQHAVDGSRLSCKQVRPELVQHRLLRVLLVVSGEGRPRGAWAAVGGTQRADVHAGQD